jgi:hypothetical protein
MSDSHKGDFPTETSDATRLAAVSKDKKEQQTASKKHQESVGCPQYPVGPIQTESTCNCSSSSPQLVYGEAAADIG